jgi:hypothetical protein
VRYFDSFVTRYGVDASGDMKSKCALTGKIREPSGLLRDDDVM